MNFWMGEILGYVEYMGAVRESECMLAVCLVEGGHSSSVLDRERILDAVTENCTGCWSQQIFVIVRHKLLNSEQIFRLLLILMQIGWGGTAMLRAGLQELYYYGNRKLISYFLVHVYCISNFTKIKCMMLILFQEEV